MQPERELTFRAAALEAIAEEMRRDPAVVMMGEDIGKAGGVFVKAGPNVRRVAVE